MKKKVGLLCINGTKFKLTAIELKTVRPFVFGELVLKNPADDDFCHAEPAEQSEIIVTEKIDEILEEVKEQLQGK